jgi:hypothetical protein
MADPQLGFFVRPDSLDFRDRIFQPSLIEVPSEIPLAAYQQVNVPILNQLGPVSNHVEVRERLRASATRARPHSTAWACTGFALATVVHYLLRRRQTLPDLSEVSEAMLFEMARRYDDYTGENYLGSSARGAMRGWNLHGVCRRDLWPFREGRQDRRLTAARAADAGTRPLGSYFRVNHKDLVALHCALAEVGVLYAVVNVHDGWLDPKKKTGKITPSTQILGSHAIAIVAYDKSGFWIQNNWGTGWAAGGFAHLPYDDWLRNGVDVWVARLGVPTFIEEPSSVALISAAAAHSSTSQVVRHLRQHLVRIHPDGHLQSNDSYGTSLDDLDTIFEEDFPTATKSWKKKRVLLFASAGLASLDATIQRGAADYRASLMGQGVYPLVFVWRTGFWDTINDVLRRALGERQHDSKVSSQIDFMLDRLDDGLEPLVRLEGGKLQWDEIKRTARQATALADGGVRLTLDRLARLVERDPSVEVHVAGHSAGAILLAPAIQLLTTTGRITSGPMKGRRGLGVPVQSCTLWAPACTTALFHQTYLPAIENRSIRRFLMMTLTEQAEAADNVAGIYRKSLLHLISAALEEEPRVPDDCEGTEIMGMAKFVLPDADSGRAGYPEFMRVVRRKSVTWMFSPAPLADDDPGQVRPVATRRHGDFDDDPGTLLATLSAILNRPAKDIRLALNRSASSAKKLRLSL